MTAAVLVMVNTSVKTRKTIEQSRLAPTLALQSWQTALENNKLERDTDLSEQLGQRLYIMLLSMGFSPSRLAEPVSQRLQ